MSGRFGWFLGGFLTAFFIIFVSGGVYSVTPPNGPVDVSYKVNRLTGTVWMVKTYSKQVGPVRVLSAREAKVEATEELKGVDMLSPPSGQKSAGKG